MSSVRRPGARRSTRGLSLLEVLLSGVLGLMLLILLTRVFLPMSKGLVRGTDQSALQQSAMTALKDLQRTLVLTPPQAANLGNGGRTLTLQPLQSVNASGRQLFATDLTVYTYDPAARKLYRRPGGLSLNDRLAYRPGAPELVSLSSPHPNQRVLCSEVERFAVTLAGETVTVELELVRKAPDGGVPERFSLKRTVLLRNGTS